MTPKLWSLQAVGRYSEVFVNSGLTVLPFQTVLGLKSVLTCDGKCRNFLDESITTWLCDGVCQSMTKPCDGKCPERGNTYLNCHGICEKFPTFYQCRDSCQSVHLPCDEVAISLTFYVQLFLHDNATECVRDRDLYKLVSYGKFVNDILFITL